MKLERRKDSQGGRLYVSVPERDIEAFEMAMNVLEQRMGASPSQIIVRLVKDAAVYAEKASPEPEQSSS